MECLRTASQPPAEKLPKVYEQHGIRFAYPDNWIATAEEGSTASAAATVTSPDTAFWTVMYYRGHHDAEKLARAVLKAFEEDYPQLEVDRTEELAPTGAILGYDLSFSYVDLLSTAAIRVYKQPAGTYVVLWQAEDQELPTVEPVFAAISTSLIGDF